MVIENTMCLRYPPPKEVYRFMRNFLRICPQRLIIIGIVLGLLSWLVESSMHFHIFHDRHRSFADCIFFPDSHELWMRLTIIVLFISFGVYAQRIVKALGQAELAITRVNKELTQIFDTAADGMRVIDKNFQTLRVNKTFLQLARISRAEGAEGQKCYEVFRGASCNTERCPMVRIQRGEERVEYDAIKVRRDGGVVPCIVTATPFCDGHGEFVGIVENFKDISDRKKTEEELQRSHEQLRHVTSHLEMAREQERRAMARKIHDELGQALTGFKMDVHWLARHLQAHEPEILEKFREMNERLDQTVQTVQRLSSELRPCLLDDLGLSAAIEWQANLMHDRLGIDFDIVSIPEDILLNDPTRITVFRIYQEALTNIARHSAATQVEVVLLKEQGRVMLTVSDNGSGITPDQISSCNSFGLRSMQERASLLKGTLTIQSTLGKGTTLRLSIPFEEQDEAARVEDTDS